LQPVDVKPFEVDVETQVVEAEEYGTKEAEDHDLQVNIPKLFSSTLIIRRPGACIIKHYGFVIYGKWTDFVVS
jgi:hypothetical protein